MQPVRFCLTLMALALLLCSTATLQAQDSAPPAAPKTAAEQPETGELQEIGREEAPSPDPGAPSAPEQGGPVVEIKDAAYWFNRGVLLSVYGNEKAAIAAFEKAAQLAPQWGSPYFQMGVAYGETGRYAEALQAINKAIELEAGKGAYYYGRGRVYLLAGDPLKARADLQKAADLGDRDAKRYLQKRAP